MNTDTKFSLSFHWSISRGRDTYGYNICSLYVDGRKAASTCGGGYDMKGTALGDWMKKQFTEGLKGLESEIQTPDGKRSMGHYGLFFYRKTKEGPYDRLPKWEPGAEISLDGGCGFSSMERILKALGWSLEWVNTGSKKSDTYILRKA